MGSATRGGFVLHGSRRGRTVAETDSDVQAGLQEDPLGTLRRCDDSNFWSTTAVVNFQAPEGSKEATQTLLQGAIREALAGSPERKGKPLSPRTDSPSTAGVSPIVSLPFREDFSLEMDGFQLQVCQDLCQPHAGPVSGIALFFPGCAGGVGPGREPGRDYDPEGLYPSVAGALRRLDAPVDIYRLSWDAHPNAGCVTTTAIELVRRALKKATRCVSAKTPHEFRLFFVGHSFGGARALEAAAILQELAKRPSGVDFKAVHIGGVCTLNTECSCLMANDVGSWGGLGSLADSRALVIAGGADEVVNPGVSRHFHKTLPTVNKELLIVPGGMHDLYSCKHQLVQKVSNFIVEGLK